MATQNEEIRDIDRQMEKLKDRKRKLSRRTGTAFDGEKLERERAAAGFSASEFVAELRKERATANKTALWNWERGAMPTGPYLMAISKILGKPAEFFFKK